MNTPTHLHTFLPRPSTVYRPYTPPKLLNESAKCRAGDAKADARAGCLGRGQMGRNSSRKQLRRSGRGRGEANSGEESVKFEPKKPEQDSGFDDLSETKYGKKQEKLSQLGLRAIDIKEIEDDPELSGMLDVR